MHLNNKVTNDLIRIRSKNGINFGNNTILYSVYNVLGDKIKSGIVHPDVILEDKLKIKVNIWDICLNAIIEKLGDDWIKSELEQNWIHASREKRIVIPNSLIAVELNVDSDLGKIIERLKNENIQATEKFIFVGEFMTVVYVKEVLSGDAPVVMPYITSGSLFLQEKE
jgi:hypothetical protein